MTNKNQLAGILLVVFGIMVTCNIYSLIPLYPAISTEFHILKQDVALGSTLFTLFYACGLLVFGPLSDIFGRKQMITFGLAISAVTTYFVSLAFNPISLYFFRSLQGFTLASFAPVAFSYTFDIYTDKSRTLWIALINAGFLAAGIIGQLFSAWIVLTWNWSTTYILFSTIYFVLFLSALIILPKTKQSLQHETLKKRLHGLIKALINPVLFPLYFIVITVLFSFVAFYEAFSYQYAEANNQLFWIRTIGISGVILSIFTGKLIARFTAIMTLKLGITLIWWSIFFLLFLDSVYSIGFLSIIFVGGVSLLIPTIIHFIGEKSGHLRGKAIALYSFILLIGASLGSAIASIFSYKVVLTVILVCYIINYVLSRFVIQKRK